MNALDELRDDPSSRKRFLKMVGGGGAAGALALLATACGDDKKDKAASGSGSMQEKAASGGSMKGDIEIVNYALTLEYLEADFYRQVIDSGVVTDKKVAALAQELGQAEQEHVDALKATVSKLGGKAAAKPKTKFQEVIDGGPKMILQTAATVENLGAAAYLGQANRIQDKEVLAAALSIHSVEARHAAALNRALGKPATPDGGFAKPASMDEVLKQVKPYIAS